MVPFNQLSPEFYTQIISQYQQKGYEFKGFDTNYENESSIILRHDIDFCTAAAVEMAKLEHRLGVSGTYYALMTSQFYNVFTYAVRRDLSLIAELGHRIGLHFDASAYDACDDVEIEKAVGQEVDILQTWLGLPVQSFSFHRPAPTFFNRDRIAGLRHSYEKTFFSDWAYISDSGGGFFYDHPIENKAIESGRNVQLLTHPIWWVSPKTEGSTPQLILEAYLANRKHSLAKELDRNCRAYTLADSADNG